MLLRSSSTPILSSWIPLSKEPQASPEPDFSRQISRTQSITLTVSSSTHSSSPSFSPCDDSFRSMTRALSEADLREPKRKPTSGLLLNGVSVEEKDEEEEELSPFLGSNGLGENYGAESWLSTHSVGDGASGGGGKIGTGGGGGDWSAESWDSNYKTEAYYQKMIESNPGNSLLLTNYAKFLKEVRGDFARAEEFCGRAILANPNNGDVLSMYADLIWKSHKDSSRAESYFNRAVKAAPEDCYVLASYASFLWDSDEEEGERGADGIQEMNNLSSQNPPLAAAS
ncbi:hypothetical protein LINPERHAP1_LOCUS17425 [Linum perenne]